MKPFLLQWLQTGHWATNVWVQSIFRTFLHSIWEGILLALAASLVISRTKRSPAKLRYNIFALLFGLFFCAVAVTLFVEFQDVQASTAPQANYGLSNAGAVSQLFSYGSATPANSGADTRLSERFNRFSRQWGPFLMSFWGILFVFKCSRLAAGLYNIRRLRRIGIQKPPEVWISRIKQFAVRLGIDKSVILLESRLAKTPQVLGFLKPVILVPIGMLAHLPPDQIEVILVHELAHIRRNDYLVNLIQHLAETIFFFNPGVLWLSSLLRRERECCCDDLVLQHESNHRSYVDALLSFGEYQVGFAMPLGGNPLLGRIRRILSRENRPLNGAEKILLGLGILIIPAFGFIMKKEVDPKKAPTVAIVAGKSSLVQRSTIRRQTAAIQKNVAIAKNKKSESNKTAIIAVESDTLPTTKDSVDELAIPPGPMNFTDISRMDRSDANGSVTIIQATDENHKKYVITKRDHHLTALSINGLNISDNQLNEYDELADFVPAVQNLQAQNLPKDWQEQWLQYTRLEVHFDHVQKKLYENSSDPAGTMLKIRELKARYDSAIHRIRSESVRKRRMANPLADVSTVIVDILTDLRKEKLFSASSDTLFLLDQTGIYLDGKKQSDDVFAPLKIKYIHQPGDHFKYLDSAGTIQTWQ